MELVAVEESKLIYLTQVHRPAGQLYLPEAVAKLIARYSFVKSPNFDQLLNEVRTFAFGKFMDAQISELKLYDDGIIVASKSNTSILDAFVDDLFVWLEEEFGVVNTIIANPEKYYESQVIVKSESDLARAIAPKNRIVPEFQALLSNGNYLRGDFSVTGFFLDCDVQGFKGRRKPARFSVERRFGVPFSEEVFFSTAPFRTGDHLDFLAFLERLALG